MATSDSSKPLGEAPSVRAPKTAEVLAQQIRRDIASGVLAEGAMLPPEHQLRELFGVSRQTLREAFRILESERLISVQRGVNGGARVNAPEFGTAARFMAVMLEHRSASIGDLYDAKAFIELEAVKRLARSHTKADVRALRTLLGRHEQALHEDPLVWWGISSFFHSTIIERLRNETLMTFEGMIAHLLRRAGLQAANNINDDTRHQRALQYHAIHSQVIGLIEARDVAAVEALWAGHNHDVKRTVTRAYSGQTVLHLVD